MNLVLVLEEDGEGMTMDMQFYLIHFQCSAEVISPLTIFAVFDLFVLLGRCFVV